MAFTYTNGTTSGQVRLLIGDTDTSDATKQIFTDAEINDFLSLGNSEVYPAAAAACRSLATASTKSALMYKAEALLQIDKQRIPEHYRLMAENFEDKALQGPVEEIDSAAYVVSHFGVDASEYVGDQIN